MENIGLSSLGSASQLTSILQAIVSGSGLICLTRLGSSWDTCFSRAVGQVHSQASAKLAVCVCSGFSQLETRQGKGLGW